MLTEKQIIKEVNSIVEPNLNCFAFFKKGKMIEYKNQNNEIENLFTCFVTKNFDLQKNESFYRLDPYISIINKKFENICYTIFDLAVYKRSDFHFYPLSCQISSLILSSKGETKTIDKDFALRIYHGSDISIVSNLICDHFKNYALKFCEKFDSENNIYQELCMPIERESVYSWITPQRILFSLVFSYLLDKENFQQIFNSYNSYFSSLSNDQLKKAYNNLFSFIKQ